MELKEVIQYHQEHKTLPKVREWVYNDEKRWHHRYGTITKVIISTNYTGCEIVFDGHDRGEFYQADRFIDNRKRFLSNVDIDV